MPRFAFQFESLLNVRRHRRDERERELARARQIVVELERQRERVIADRTSQLDEMRQLGSGGELDVDAASRRRYFATQLFVDIARLDQQQKLAEEHVQACQQRLIEADQSVKVLEKLKEKQQEDFTAVQEARSQRELEEAWSGTRMKDEG